MLLSLLWLPVLPMASSSPFQCYSCGVFLSAPTATCKGEPKKINCTGSGIRNGCISVTALNTDGSYYVEKRCADSEERKLNDGECVNMNVWKLKEMRKCFCAKELCNGGSAVTAAIHLSILNLFLGFLIICLLNKSIT
uniref:Protein quiver n=2 Tax=Loa loa TaxID=7209 RepID=A0A1I7VXM8_LOALO